jgi:polyribonucleotide nucleotidyltransferase
MKEVRFETAWGTDTLTVSINDLAANANASVLVSAGETVVLVTAVMGGVVDLGYLPLKVDVEERFYATGAIMGSQYTRREGVSDEATVTARAVDRALRPLFPKHLTRDVHIVGTVLSLGEYDPDSLMGVGSSIALSISNIPWHGPLGYARVGINNDQIVLHPKRGETPSGMVLCSGNKDGLVMIEGEAGEVSESSISAMLSAGLQESVRLAEFVSSIQQQVGVEKFALPEPKINPAVESLFLSSFKQRLIDTLFSKESLSLKPLSEEWVAACKQLEDVNPKQATSYFETQTDIAMHEEVLKRNTRSDGRALNEIRPLFAQAGGISEKLHGVGIFYRGITHVLSVLTMGPLSQSLSIETMEEQGTKRFIHHYNFPPFAPGETGRLGPNRRSIGHGRLVEKALHPVLPEKDAFPYAMRIVSECLSSGGSTSMASTCASTLALIDAGVPITRPVVGIAMGLITDGTQYLVLTDVQGPEDHHGDMDLKVTGTEIGITALQMDIKVAHVPLEVVVRGISEARSAHTTLLKTISEASVKRGTEAKKSVPRTERVSIPEDKIGLVIGTHGKTVKGIEESTGAAVHIRGGVAEILGTGEAVLAAKERILQILNGEERQTT